MKRKSPKRPAPTPAELETRRLELEQEQAENRKRNEALRERVKTLMASGEPVFVPYDKSAEFGLGKTPHSYHHMLEDLGYAACLIPHETSPSKWAGWLVVPAAWARAVKSA